MPSIQFLGAAGTVTGSRFLVRAGGRQVLLDAGLFQGQKELRLRNWAPFPVDAAAVDAVVLTHAHLDHAGALPLLWRQGFRGPAYCTAATRDLATLLLPDSGRLQEEEARFANEKGYSRHAPQARPLHDEVFVDSPMAVDATPIHLAHREDHDEEMRRLFRQGIEPLRPARLGFARTPEQSKAMNRVEGPCVIISASGMATGGRVLHHLARRLPDPRTTVMLVGYQAAGTRGWSLQNGARTLRIHGEDVPVRAAVVSLSGFSAHGDKDEVDRWLGTLPSRPRRVFCVHGEPPALAATAARLASRGWEAAVARDREVVDLAA